MISNLLKMLSYPFMQRALVVGILVSLCAALLGVSLVLKRYSMIGDGLSHVSFGPMSDSALLQLQRHSVLLRLPSQSLSSCLPPFCCSA